MDTKNLSNKHGQIGNNSSSDKTGGSARKRRVPKAVVEAIAKSGTTLDPAAVKTAAAEVRAIAANHGLEPAVNRETRKSLAGDGALPASFIELSMSVATEHASLVGEHFDAAKVEEAQAFLTAVKPLRDAVSSLYRVIEDNVLRKKAVLGGESRKLYRFLQVLPDTSHASTIAEALDRMTKAMQRPRQKPVAETPTGDPPPDPQSTVK